MKDPAPHPSTGDLRERAADAALRAVRRVPPLAVIAVVAGLVELTLARAIWNGFTDTVDASLLFELRRQARFPRNLAAVGGLLAVTVSLVAFLRLPGFASVGRRLAVAAFSGIFVPSVAVAALLPAAMLRPRLVVFGLAAANVLVALVTLTAVRYRPERLLRIALGLASVTAFSTLVVIAVGQLASAQGGLWGSLGALLSQNPTTTQHVRLVIRHAGELCWLGVLVTCAVVAIWDRGAGAVRTRLGVAVTMIVASCAGLVALEALTGHRFRFLLFGSFRLGLFVDDHPLVYGPALALGLVGGLLALIRRDGGMRQLGAGTLAWLAAGFAPHTPIQLLYLVLGGLLLARAAQARDPQGGWRQHQPWSRLLSRRPTPPSEAPDLAE